ncbi:hypothetical protein ACFWM5_40035 [Streptomyces bobili]|uniref:hypothetical protein n=1 Tax=Streptomyces bobili TaxID=67280 RepID=UPI00365A1E1B
MTSSSTWKHCPGRRTPGTAATGSTPWAPPSCGTAAHGVREQSGALDSLFGWLLTHADPHTGLWGEHSAADGLTRVVNGFYRASRGTFTQYGLPEPYPERTIDSVLQHTRDTRYTRGNRQTACNIMDSPTHCG